MTSPIPAAGRSLAELRPDLAAEWDHEANVPVLPSQVTASSGRRFGWVCAEGHRWVARVTDRNHGRGCPGVHREDSLAARRPDLAAQWDVEANGALTPADITANSAKRIHWVCDEGHRWVAQVYNRADGDGCGRPHRGESLLDRNPALAAEWDHAANGDLTPADVFSGSNRRVHWICAEGHRWTQVINTRNKGRGSGCPGVHRAESLANRFPDVAAEWAHDLNDVPGPDAVSAGTARRVHWRCAAGHIWQAKVFQRSQGYGCPQCKAHGTSKQEQALREAIAAHHPEAVGRARLPFLGVRGGLLPDIHLPTLRIAIDFDGAWWHRNTLARDCARIGQYAELGIDLIRVREAPLRSVGPWDVEVGPYRTYETQDVASAVIERIQQILVVRLRLAAGQIDPAQLSDGGHALHLSYRAMAEANGVAPDDPRLRPCRDPYPLEDQ